MGIVYVDERPSTRSTYYCREMASSWAPSGRTCAWFLAHELRHHVLRHCGGSFANEVEANALAVQILQVWGVSEADATRETARQLLPLTKSSRNTLLGGHDLGAELRDLLSRYPTAVDPRRPGECGAS